MKGGDQPWGFTIVETMIVLAVTAFLFLSAIEFVQGKQAKTQFRVAINSLQQQFQQIINETASGHYINHGDFTCQSASPGATPVISGGSGSQGSNQGCIFLGMALRFGTLPGTATDNSDFAAYAVIANQQTATSPPQEVSQISQVHQVVLYPTTSGNNSTAPSDDYTVYKPQNGLTFVWQSHDYSSTQYPASQTTIIGLLYSLASYTGTVLASNPTQLGIYGFTNFGSSADIADDMDYTSGPTSPQFLASPIEFIALCFASGTTNESGLITIGPDSSPGSGSGLSVGLRTFSDTTCT